MRFTPEASKGRHRFAWVPFGGGAHMCIGLHFATMQMKLLMAHLLTRYRIEADAGSGAAWQFFPIPRPKDGLPVRLCRSVAVFLRKQQSRARAALALGSASQEHGRLPARAITSA